MFKSELRNYKAVSSLTCVPLMTIEVLLDTRELTTNQTLVLSGERGTRVRVDNTFTPDQLHRSRSSASGLRSPLSQGASSIPSIIVLERWSVELQPGSVDVDLPSVYKHAIVLFRCLFGLMRILPAWSLNRSLARHKVGAGLRMNCKMKVNEGPVDVEEGEIGLETPICQGEADKVTETIHLPGVVTPLG